MPAKQNKVQLTAEEFAERARITNWGVWILLFVLAATFVVDVIALIFLLSRLQSAALPELMALSVMIVFLSIVLLTVVFFFLAGLGYITASDVFLKWLGGITVAELASMATTILGFYLKK